MLTDQLILTSAEVRKAISVDPDYPEEDLLNYSRTATSFLHQKTGYNWASDDPRDPEAVQAALMYVRQLHYGQDGYDRDHDYSLGINCLIEDLKDKARGKNA